MKCQANLAFEKDGVSIWTVQGTKNPTDVAVEIDTHGRKRINLSLILILADLFAQIEDNLYPPESGYEGGKKLLGRISFAIKHGCEAAIEKTENEIRWARSKIRDLFAS